MHYLGRWLFYLLLITPAAFADESIVLDDMTAVSCRIEGVGREGVRRCNLYYQDLQIHQGREISEVLANGDCVGCRSMVAYAVKSKLKLIVDRNRNWGTPDFLGFTSEAGFAPSVLQRLNDLEYRVQRLENW